MREWRDLPPSWAVAPLELLAEINPRAVALPESDGSPVHFVPMRAVTEEFGGIDVSERRSFGAVRKGYTAFQAEDVLFAKITPCMENGKLALVPELQDGIGFGSTEFHVVRARAGVAPRWLAYFLSQAEFRKFARRNMTGTAGQLRVATQWLSATGLPLAPAAEQTRIVDKLEELLSDLDAGVAELKAAQKKLAQYRQSLLKAAVEGQLTEAWRAQHGEPEESGAQLLARILRERRARREAKQHAKFEAQGKAPPKGWQTDYDEPSIANDTKLPALPSGWTWATLGELTDTLTSGSRDWSPFYDRGTCTFVMAQNVRPWRPDFTFKQLVDPPLGHRDRARSMIRKDDLLVTIVGANTGQACRVDKELNDHFVCQSVALIRLSDSSLSEFVNGVLNSPEHGQRQFREMNYGAGRPHLSFDQLESVLVPLPPLAEQQEMLRQFEIAQSLIDGVESQIVTASQYCAAQRKNILQAAFSGQLVPQDPNDEPASELLERIRAERVVSGATKVRRGRTTGTMS